MKPLITLVLFLALAAGASPTMAAKSVYSIRADGLACPYCAYGIEKKFNALPGVRFTDIDLEKGIVTVETRDVQLNDAQLEKLFKDAGFTYRGKTVQSVEGE